MSLKTTDNVFIYIMLVISYRVKIKMLLLCQNVHYQETFKNNTNCSIFSLKTFQNVSLAPKIAIVGAFDGVETMFLNHLVKDCLKLNEKCLAHFGLVIVVTHCKQVV